MTGFPNDSGHISEYVTSSHSILEDANCFSVGDNAIAGQNVYGTSVGRRTHPSSLMVRCVFLRRSFPTDVGADVRRRYY